MLAITRDQHVDHIESVRTSGTTAAPGSFALSLPGTVTSTIYPGHQGLARSIRSSWLEILGPGR
jgi:hypothetical protein